MKNIIVAAALIASVIAPSVTFAQNGVFTFPTFYFDANSTQAPQPATKLDINTTSETVAPTNEKADSK